MIGDWVKISDLKSEIEVRVFQIINDQKSGIAQVSNIVHKNSA